MEKREGHEETDENIRKIEERRNREETQQARR